MCIIIAEKIKYLAETPTQNKLAEEYDEIAKEVLETI